MLSNRPLTTAYSKNTNIPTCPLHHRHPAATIHRPRGRVAKLRIRKPSRRPFPFSAPPRHVATSTSCPLAARPFACIRSARAAPRPPSGNENVPVISMRTVPTARLPRTLGSLSPTALSRDSPCRPPTACCCPPHRQAYPEGRCVLPELHDLVVGGNIVKQNQEIKEDSDRKWARPFEHARPG